MLQHYFASSEKKENKKPLSSIEPDKQDSEFCFCFKIHLNVFLVFNSACR